MIKLIDLLIDNSQYIHVEKYNKVYETVDYLSSALYEMTLSSDNAAEIQGDTFNGEFEIRDIKYIYTIETMLNPYKDNGIFYNISFDEKHNQSRPNSPTGNAKQDYIKTLSTMYKVILNLAEEAQPEYIGISSLDRSGYRNIYNNLTKTNKIPGYIRKDAGLDFKNKEGDTGKFIVLKKL